MTRLPGRCAAMPSIPLYQLPDRPVLLLQQEHLIVRSGVDQRGPSDSRPVRRPSKQAQQEQQYDGADERDEDRACETL